MCEHEWTFQDKLARLDLDSHWERNQSQGCGFIAAGDWRGASEGLGLRSWVLGLGFVAAGDWQGTPAQKKSDSKRPSAVHRDSPSACL